MERRKGERLVVPDLYRKYITFKVREVSGDFVDAELFNFSSRGIRIKSRYELPFGSTIECLVSAPKSFTTEALVAEIPEKKESPMPGGHGGGGMGDMY